MEARSPRPGFSLDALIAEAKRRARQRRLLVLLLLIVVAAVAAAVTFGSSAGGSRPGGVSGKVGSPSDGSQSAQLGPFGLTVPRGFYEETECSNGTNCSRGTFSQLLVSNHPLTTAYGSIFSANRVTLQLDGPGKVRVLQPQQLPLDFHKLDVKGDPRGSHGMALLSGGGSYYEVSVVWGRNVSAADRASILRALSSIRRRG